MFEYSFILMCDRRDWRLLPRVALHTHQRWQFWWLCFYVHRDRVS